MSFEWLGVGSVRCGFIINGEYIVCHTFTNANEITNVYMTTAILPVRYEIVTSSALAASMKSICSSRVPILIPLVGILFPHLSAFVSVLRHQHNHRVFFKFCQILLRFKYHLIIFFDHPVSGNVSSFFPCCRPVLSSRSHLRCHIP